MRDVGAGVKGMGACLPLFSWGTALGMVLGGGGSLVLSKRDGGVLGRTLAGGRGGRNVLFGGSEGCDVKAFHFSQGPIKHEEKIQFNRDNLINCKPSCMC